MTEQLTYMKSYSKKQLAGIDVNAYCETQKLTIAKDASTYLRKNLSSNAWVEIAICIFFMAALVYFYFSGYINLNQCLFLTAVILTSSILGGLMTPYRQYKEWKDREIFYLVNELGINTVAESEDGERYERESGIRWEFVRKITFCDDHIIVLWKSLPLEYPKKLFMWSENIERDRHAILTWWARFVHSDKVEVPVVYSEEDLERIESFVNKKFGKCDGVFHEWISRHIHVNVHIIPPTEERNYYTLCTVGAGARTMWMGGVAHLSPKEQPTDHAEYLIYLPADWDFSEEGLKDERNNWPIRLLRQTARYPITTWGHLAWGHTIADEKNIPFAYNNPFCCAFLLSPAPQLRKASLCNLPSGITVEFFQVLPITQSELDMKTGKNGVEKLLKAIRNMQKEEPWTNFAVRRLKQNLAPYRPHPDAEPYHYEFLQMPVL